MKEVALLIVGGLIAGASGFLGHLWTEKRERRNRRDELMLDLYVEVIGLIIDDEKVMATTTEPRSMPSLDHQAKQYSISHRLKLLGSVAVQAAYKEYHGWVFKETTHPVRPMSPDYV